MPTSPLSRLLDVSKVLANRARLRILAALEGRELCVGQVAAIFDVARSTASEHLSALRRVGLVAERRDGKFAYYSLVVDERARKFLDVVLSELSADAAVRKDRDLTGRILALPHDLVCEQGRAALNMPVAAAVPTADPSSSPCPKPHTNSERQEVP
ncbi:MAG: winged helix-turn-helix transcriptional regulator [Holophagales bacterium]|nr:winged helix-turn-helix transcriptional regulator [Holophagales bacterium]